MIIPSEILEEGCELLDPVLVPHGFERTPISLGRGSGGDFAHTEYLRRNRRLELHFRHSLGLVTYHVGELALAHEQYMRALLGRNGANQYPGFSEDPLDGFRHLRHDLKLYCGEFLQGSDEVFQQVVASAAARVSGFRALS